MKFSDAPPVHRPLTDKGWRGFPTLLLASTDDKESAIIAIFTDLVIFGPSGRDLAPIFVLHAAPAAATAQAPDAAHAARRSFRKQFSDWKDLAHQQNNLLPLRLYSFPAKTLN
ncbi:hypothetical protein [Cupriavidus neocaledonicus]|uniref:hypothetical protein n=1 Tax=Cupriavidus neocaledonicus TaxID=1040979 RepID=UPI000363FF44|nr:hypothetical protein [Cupriavidus neocaledonicus]